MNKFIRVLSAAAIALVSFATVASAKITNDVFKPEWQILVTSVEDGAATIEFSIEFDTELSYTQNGSGLSAKYTGYGLTQTDLLFDMNSDLFDADLYYGEGAFGNIEYDSNADNFYVSHLWNNKIADAKVGKVLNHGYLQVQLKDEYANLTADELNAMEFLTVVKAGLQIGHWNDAKGKDAIITSFYSDGTATFDCAYRVGAEPVTPPTPPAPTASVAISAAKKTTDAAWIAEKGNTMFWGVDFANGGFNGTAVAKIFSDAKERELTIATPAGAEINGEASFGVFVIVGDSTDAIGLTITSGDVTATAAPVAYADAE